ncbi:cell wall integrity and stress response component 4-like isoform X3 [Polyodon spathula]|uniref:cell wall integrity and stress response component 4-like isoform X3 n=1 Tax=Polyodon spathula TaxID=7913 RepID=UPI001B7F68AF|nr:cell wall integrity and stress response component 4-like isoform X3 [Polyodon spathula]
MKSTGIAFLLFIFLSSLVNVNTEKTASTPTSAVDNTSRDKSTPTSISATPAANTGTDSNKNTASSTPASTAQTSNGTTATSVIPTSEASTTHNARAFESSITVGNKYRDKSTPTSLSTTPAANTGTDSNKNTASSTPASTAQTSNAVGNKYRDNSEPTSLSTTPAANTDKKILWVMLPVLIALVGIVLIVMKFKCFTHTNNQDASENDTENVSKDGVILLRMKKPGEETAAR